MKRLPVPTRRALVIGAWIVGLAVIALIAYLLSTVIHLTQADDASLADRSDLRTELADQETKTTALAEQLKGLGETPVVEPDTPLTPDLRYMAGPRGPIGPTGPTGKSGEDSTTPGAPGATGSSGVDGKDSTTAGPTGPAGKDGAAGKDGVNGAPGKDGSNGSNGADGRGISSLSCFGVLAPITFTVTYTDGTSAEFTCGSAVVPDPEPSE